jgi:very-short-patch-repair endonuclease
MVVPYNKNLKEISKKLRHRPTEAERCLWKRLRLKHLGYVFHRQKPIGGYIADFYCPEAKIVIEIDGDYHSSTETADNDRVRDEIMHNLGMTILRIPNSEILNDTDRVISKIMQMLADSTLKNSKYNRVVK